MTIASGLVCAGAGIILLLGTLHLRHTYFSNNFSPREADLEARLKTAVPVITDQTTLWRSLIGFNASHSLGAILFGLLYLYLPLVRPALFFSDAFLQLAGLGYLVAMSILAKRYWFSVPYKGILLATLLYLAGLGLSLAAV
ncbi:LIC_13387 family protein [Parachitinimonas caeni]|uniref:MAPEG family protein n=1 Tax=Parachitinimonas caeni TaxID=3031301 RepID=A0ABT7E3E6_9NEIS|nr:hypothetical protein [Parachitinimonas caeni]MDK2126843.1 hypothetical protein [Parachitinimonas caeni]